MAARIFSGVGLGLLLGLLLGLSTSPVVALVVGALAALLGSLVLPRLRSKDGEGAASSEPTPQERRSADWRAGALGVACTVGLLCGIWIRTHDLLSPPAQTLLQRVDELRSIGFTPEEARRLVAGAVAPTAPSPGPGAGREVRHGSVLFSGRGEKPCDRLAPGRFATLDAAAMAYDSMSEVTLARIARALRQLPDTKAAEAAMAAVVEASCTGE